MRKTIAALAVGLLLGTAAMQISAAIPPITTPTDPSQTIPKLISWINTYLGNMLSLSAKTGELQFSASQSWATNSNVATTMTSLGPQGASTTVSKWLTVVDNNGDAGFIPWYKYTP
jgi:hypothetical protein